MATPVATPTLAGRRSDDPHAEHPQKTDERRSNQPGTMERTWQKNSPRQVSRVRGKGEGAVYRVPKDKTKPLQYWCAAVELPSHDGKRRRKVVRRKNKPALLAELDRLRGDLAQQGDLPTHTVTVEQWFTYWLREIAVKKVRPNTFDGYERTVLNHVIPAIGKVKLDKVSGATIRKVHDAIASKGLSSTTALLAHRVMSTSLKQAVREGRIGRNPCDLIDPPRKAATELEALDLEESLKLLAHLADKEDGALWATVLLTGARRGEVIGLECDRVIRTVDTHPVTREAVESWHIDLSWQLIRIKKTDVEGVINAPSDYEYRHVDGGLYLTRPKSSKGWRIIPLVEPLRSILLRHIATMDPNPWGLVFPRVRHYPSGKPKPVRPYGPDLASKDWRDLLTSAGIEADSRLHDGRHTTVDLLYAAGVPEDLISELVGHSTRTMTQGYKTLRNRERLTAAVEQFSTLFEPKQLSA